jgi:hypothetical protein
MKKFAKHRRCTSGNEESLHFPVITQDFSPLKRLSMDEYLEFILVSLQMLPEEVKITLLKAKLLEGVPVKFSFVDTQ